MVVRKGATTLNIYPVFKDMYLAQGFSEEVEKVDVNVEEKSEAPIDEEIKEDEDKTPTYTKTDINRMSAEDLKALAPILGIEVTEESKGAELKAKIIETLGL